MHFSQQFCRPSNPDSANHITLKMRVVENIIQYIYYAFSRTLIKIVGDVGAVHRYLFSNGNTNVWNFLRQTSETIKPPLNFIELKVFLVFL